MKNSRLIFAILLVFILALSIIPNSFAADNITNTTLNTQNTIITTNTVTSQVNTITDNSTISQKNVESTNNINVNKTLTQTETTNNSLSSAYSSGTYTNLDNAISSSNQIYLTGNIQLTGDEKYTYIDGITINKSVTINGQGYTINGLDLASHFYVNKSTLTLKNLILTGGYTNRFGGSIFLDTNANLILDNVTFINNYANYTGAIFGSYNNKINITNCKFINCSSYSLGGAITFITSNVMIKNSIFTNDYSQTDTGGAIYSETSNLTVTNCDFTECNASIGGAIAQLDGKLNVNYCNFLNNNATYYGGAIYNIYATLNIYQSNFQYNSAIDGGALYVDNSTNLKIQSSNFTNNIAILGGVIYTYQDNVFTNTNNYFNNNYAVNGTTIYYQPDPIIRLSNNQSKVIYTNYTYTNYIPSYYNLKDYGYLTTVKNQGDSGSCWALSAMASLESCILKANGGTYDLSEENLKNLMAEFSQYDYADSYPNDGGLNEMVYGYLAGWLGPVNETQEAFDVYSTVSPVLDNVLNVQNILTLRRSSYTDNNAIKLAVLNYGAVAVGMHYDDDYLKFDSYYYNGAESIDHGVCIVGWDDTYSKSNFKNVPAGNGAWIVRNTWGPDWGDDGYFYVSYYDTRLAQLNLDDAYTFIFNDSTKYDKNYQYDYVTMTDYLSTGSKTAYYSVQYNSTGNEYLEAFSTYFNTTTDYTANIYVNNSLKYTQTGYSNSGYYTIKLAKNVTLNKGDTFKIVLKIKTNTSADIPIQEYHSTRAVVHPGVSYYSIDGTRWTDLATYDYYDYGYDIGQVACLKAFTVNKTGVNINVPSITGSPGVSQTVTIGVTNNDGANVNNGIITVNINGNTYNANVVDGVANVNIKLPSNSGVTNIIITYSNDTYTQSVNSTITTSNVVSAVNLITNNLTEVYGAGANYTGTLTDSNGSPIVGQHIAINLTRNSNGQSKVYWVTTDTDGAFQLQINLSPGFYTGQASYGGNSLYQSATSQINSIIVTSASEASYLFASNFTEYYGAGANFTGFLMDDSSNPLIGQHITINLTRVSNGQSKLYYVTTDTEGDFQLQINLGVGYYTAQCSYSGTSKYGSSIADGTISVISL